MAKSAPTDRMRSTTANTTVIITIDGPSASGKTTLARELAKHFQYEWVSTGALYRGVAVLAEQHQVSVEDEDRLLELLKAHPLDLRPGQNVTEVWQGHENLTQLLYKESVGGKASVLSAHAALRLKLLDLQRQLGQQGRPGLVAEGRDCGTVVFPNADFKVFLTASEAERAERRALQSGGDANLTAREQSLRDQRDATRAAAPMRMADGALQIDSSGMKVPEVLAVILDQMRLSPALSLQD